MVIFYFHLFSLPVEISANSYSVYTFIVVLTFLLFVFDSFCFPDRGRIEYSKTMWHEALFALGAFGASMSIIEIAPFVCHYLGCGCPMLRYSHSNVSQMLYRRDQRIAENYGVRSLVKHQFTFGLNKLDEPVQTSGNVQQYIDAEKKFKSK